MHIAVGCDHSGLPMKQCIFALLEDMGHTYRDFGVHTEEAFDYPLIGRPVAQAVAAGEADRGILLCGTGIGIGITANKTPGIRCAICSEPFSAVMSRKHNDANVLALGTRVVGLDMAAMIVRLWLETEFEADSERHVRRVSLIEVD